MAKRIETLVGEKYGRLTVVRECTTATSRRLWECLCECGKTSTVEQCNLRNKHTTSCGCYGRKTRLQPTHGMSKTRIYKIWHGMVSRCTKVNIPEYRLYGGRGIKVCERWSGKGGFLNFLADMGNAPSLKHSLDRIDNNGPYSPENCRWASQVQQMNNTRVNRHITFRGETKTLAEWGRATGISAHSIMIRIDRLRWTIERALTTPICSRSKT